MKWDSEPIAQIQLPALEDDDEHPRLLLNGEGIRAGQSFTALMPSGWEEITLESNLNKTGASCWYISTPEFRGVCPVGLFVLDPAVLSKMRRQRAVDFTIASWRLSGLEVKDETKQRLDKWVTGEISDEEFERMIETK